MRLHLSIIVVTLLGISLYSPSVHASVIISEFLPDPSSPNDETEWIELYNSSQDEVSITGWAIDDKEGGSKPYILKDATIPANSTFVIEKIDSKIALNNSGDEVRLFDAQMNLVDNVVYTSVPEDQSYAWINSIWQINPQPSKNQPNKTSDTTENTVETSKSITLKLSEIYACPGEGEHEWIEIINTSESDGVLDDWSLTDEAQNSVTLSGNLGAGKLHLLILENSILNNSGDTLYLHHQDKLIDSVTYPKCSQGDSYIMHEGSWQASTIPTANSLNISSPPTLPTIAPKIEKKESIEAKSLPEASKTPQQRPTSNPTIDLVSDVSIASASYQASVAGIIQISTKSAGIESSASAKHLSLPNKPHRPWLLLVGIGFISIGVTMPYIKNLYE